jgi:hypothetical protein
MMKCPLKVLASLGHQEMDMGMEIYLLSERLDDGQHSGAKLSAGCDLEVADEGPDGRPAELPQKPALVLEEDSEHLRDGEDDLTVGDIKKKPFPYPLPPFLKPLRMTRWAESPGAAGKHDEPLLATVRATNPGKPTVRIAAIEIPFHNLLDDRPEEPILLLETAFIVGQEPVEMMKKHPVEDGALGMSRTVNSCHSRSYKSKNRPKCETDLFEFSCLEEGAQETSSLLQRVNRS